MALRENYDFSILGNEAEHLVISELERQIEALDGQGICFCQDCVLDMACLALNSVKPFYRVSLLGTMYAHAQGEGEYRAEIAKAVEAAIAKVHASPSHD
ncbi:MAG: late competence development ComFB family protein [Treponema sp.]|nr:late competence development ComFB family protein [Treponema sp.]